MKTANSLLIFGIIVGALLFITCVSILIAFPVITRNLILKNVPLINGSYSAQKWGKPDYAISMDFWLYNVTNPDEVLFRGAKPSLSRKGPYSFTEKQRKDDIEYNSTTGHIKYLNIKTYFFNASRSCATCSKNDVFIVPNVPYLTAMNTLNAKSNMSGFVRNIFHLTLLAIGEHPFTSQTVDELLFNGYKDKLFSLLQWLKGIPEFSHVPDRMGFFYPKNGSDDGEYTIDSGCNDASKLGQILDWNGLGQNLGFWNSPVTNAIRGTDGSLFGPFVSKSSILQMFVSDICRSIFAIYHSESSFDGVKTYRFYVPEMASSSKNLDNAGFCQPTDQIFYPKSQKELPAPNSSSLFCLPSGLLNVTKCRFGAPIVISNPNFLYSPDEVAQSVSGLSPASLANDASFLDIEPHSGVLVNAVRRLQINVAMYKIGKMLQYITPVIVPVIFLNESAKIDDQTKEKLYESFSKAPAVAHGVSYTFLVVGVALAIVCAILLFRQRRNEGKSDEFEDQPSISTVSRTDSTIISSVS